MSERNIKVGQLVQILGKNTTGRVAYVGVTNFSPGKWVGVVLDEAKGKNNGTVKGYCYFKCSKNCGVFVRPTQLITMNESAEEPTSSNELASISKAEEKHRDDLLGIQHHLRTTQLSHSKHFLSSSSQSSLNCYSSSTMSELSASSNLIQSNQSTGPKRSKTTVSPSETFRASKHASFFETGFMEILRPKFTPGPPMRSPSFTLVTDEHKRMDEMKAQVNEMTEELEILRKHRADDKRKLQELDKARIQCEQLLEFKAKIMESHGNLQRDLQRSRQETREANEAKAKCLCELTEMSENLELLTLDKEMAEEKADTLQMELEIAIERIEELVLDVEILRAEKEGALAADDNCSKESNAPTLGELRKLQQHNHRLKETVIRLRDVIAQDKQEIQKATKELETKFSEICELQKTKAKLSLRIDNMEMQIIDLHEQVDAALGAESMVETLTESKLELEERLKLLEEEISELEALEEIHEQLIESNQELEMDLREEIDLLSSANRALQQEKDAALETIYDRDVTIIKFRELVKTLNEQHNMQLIKDTPLIDVGDSISSLETTQDAVPSLDFNQLFAESKAYCRAIDVRLSKMELQESKKHIDYILEFMPEEFMVRGGDYDAIMVLLLLERLTVKSQIICDEIKEKFPSTTEFDKYSIFEGFSVHRFAFRSRFIYFIRSFQMVLHQILYGLNHCEYDTLVHAAIYRSEMQNYEKHIDAIIEFLKSGQLDENSSTESIERIVTFFTAMYSTLVQHQDSNDLLYEHKMYHDIIEIFDAGCDCLMTNAVIIQTIIQVGDETTGSFWLMQYIIDNVGNFKQKLKTLRRKIPREAKFEFIGMTRDQIHRLKIISESFGKFITILSMTAKDAVKAISSFKSDESADVSLDHVQLWQMLSVKCAHIYQDEDKSPITNFQLTIDLIDEQINEIFHFIRENENATISNANTMCVRSETNPILVRAKQLKQQLEQVKKLSMSLSQREAEIKHLKLSAKKKLNEYSEMQIRKEMAERNVAKLQLDSEMMLETCKNRLNELQDYMLIRETAIAETIQRLDEKLLELQKRNLELKHHLDSKASNASLVDINSHQELHFLSNVLEEERCERMRLQTNHLKCSFRKLEPVFVPKKLKDQSIIHFEQQLRQIKNQWILSHIDLKISNSNFKKKNLEKSHLKQVSYNLAEEIKNEYFKRNPHRSVRCNFSAFPATDIGKLFM